MAAALCDYVDNAAETPIDPNGGSVLGEPTSPLPGSPNIPITPDPEPPAPQRYRLTVSTSGSGSGEVESNPPGIDCGSDCSEDYPEGTQVSLV